MLAAKQVEQTMACFRHEDGDPISIVGEMTLPCEVQVTSEEGEIILQLFSRCFQIFQIEFYAHVIPFCPRIGVLLAMEDIVTPGKEVLGYGRQQPFSVITLDEEYNLVHEN